MDRVDLLLEELRTAWVSSSEAYQSFEDFLLSALSAARADLAEVQREKHAQRIRADQAEAGRDAARAEAAKSQLEDEVGRIEWAVGKREHFERGLRRVAETLGIELGNAIDVMGIAFAVADIKERAESAEREAAALRERLTEAVDAEREACAKVAVAFANAAAGSELREKNSLSIAAAIRARKAQP